jgi:hypothetical protein
MTNSSIDFSRDHKRRNRAFFGLVLVLLGGLFFLQQWLNLVLYNWWALFLLIPALGAISSGIGWWQRAGRFTESTRGSFGSGLLLLVVTAMFLLGLDWLAWWPLVLITVGILMLANGFPLPGSREVGRPLALRLYRPWVGWSGLGVTVLGFGFLALGRGWPLALPAGLYWWGVPFFIPALGGLVTAVRLAVAGDGLGWANLGNWITTAMFAAVGVIALVGIGWNVLAPILIIAAGVVLLVGSFNRRD